MLVLVLVLHVCAGWEYDVTEAMSGKVDVLIQHAAPHSHQVAWSSHNGNQRQNQLHFSEFKLLFGDLLTYYMQPVLGLRNAKGRAFSCSLPATTRMDSTAPVNLTAALADLHDECLYLVGNYSNIILVLLCQCDNSMRRSRNRT